MKPKKIKRPESFTYYGMTWTIKYFDARADCLGETFLDLNYINIFTKGVNEEVVRETLQHELQHVVKNGIIPLFVGSSQTPNEIEEHQIRIESPRLFALYSQNPHLPGYIYLGK